MPSPSSTPDLSQFNPLAAHPFTSYSTPSPPSRAHPTPHKHSTSHPTSTTATTSPPKPAHAQQAVGTGGTTTTTTGGGIFTCYTAKSLIGTPASDDFIDDDNLESILKRKTTRSGSKTSQTSTTSSSL